MINKLQIKNFTMHGESGVQVLCADFLNWLKTHNSEELGSKVIAYSWSVGEQFFKLDIDISKIYWRELPDASGFICFESEWKPDNCLLLNAYGKERLRLTVPWQMTGATHPAASQPPTCFDNISEPYNHPETGEKGKFGVTAYIADVFGWKFYFELDYHTGEFLWCTRIKD